MPQSPEEDLFLDPVELELQMTVRSFGQTTSALVNFPTRTPQQHLKSGSLVIAWTHRPLYKMEMTAVLWN